MNQDANAAAIDVVGVSKIFRGADEVRALDDVSVAIRANEFFTLLGLSGCGKITLLRVIAGFEPPTMGSLMLGGRDISRLPPNQRPVNTVFQSYALFPHMSVAHNIAFGLEMLGKPKGEIRDTVDAMLRLVQMEELKARPPRRSRADSSSAWRWLGRWRRIRRCCCWTSRSRRWISSCARRCRSS